MNKKKKKSISSLFTRENMSATVIQTKNFYKSYNYPLSI